MVQKFQSAMNRSLEYANENPLEDFSEALALYFRVKGTDEEPEVRALYAERFAILDELLSKPMPPKPA